MRAIIRSDEHFIQWFVLSELQTCSDMSAYLDKKTRLCDFMWREFIDHKATFYGLILVEEARRDRSGIVTYSHRIKSPPTPPRPEKRGAFKVYSNEKWRVGDDLKL